MVNFLRGIFSTFFTSLYDVSDGMCQNNGRSYIKFDDIFPNYRTVDALILPQSNKYLLFVEFKDVKRVANIKKWLSKKERVQSLWLKGYESYIMLCQFVVANSSFDYNAFCRFDKRFILVYDAADSKKKIHNHFRGKVKRLESMYNHVLVYRCNAFYNFLQGNDL